MKQRNLLTLFSDMLLTFLIGLSGIGCLCTAFELAVSPGPILLACGFFAVLVAVMTRIKRGGLLILAAVILCGVYLWKKGIVDSVLYFAKTLLRIYRMAYDFSIPEFIAGAGQTDLTLAVTLIAAACTLIAGMSLSCSSAYGAIVALLLPVVPCFIVIDTVPAPGWLLAMLLCLALLLLSQNVRNIDPQRASRVVAFLLIPVLLAGWLLFRYHPKDSYQRPSEEENFGDRVLEYVDQLPFLKVEDGEIVLDFEEVPTFTFPQQEGTVPSIPFGSGGITIPPVSLGPGIFDLFQESVSLGNAGPRDPGDTVVMQVETTYRGTIYLRERGYDIYTGTTWESSGEEQMLSIHKEYLSPKTRKVTIKTKWPHQNYFVPYHSFTDDQAQWLEDGKMENPDAEIEYSFSMHTLSDSWKGLWLIYLSTTIGQIEDPTYTQLPQDTLAGAQQILQGLGITDETLILEAAMKIQSFVRECANYDLNTEKMPEEFSDFALWFLEESETGYCVHFATAATVLLRAAGIPARYVEGYMARSNAATTHVLASDAHAWVEYYLPEVGWIVLEPTPGGSASPNPPLPTTGPTVPPTTQPTQPTQPTTTVPPTTQPTGPSTAVPPTTQTTPPSVPDTNPSATTTGPVGSTTTVPPTTEPTVPSTTTPADPVEPPKDLTALWSTLATVFAVLGIGCALYGQWQLRLWIKRRWLSRGSSNRRAIKLWHESRMLARLRCQKAPQALRDLAWKAKFSQHTITDAELDAFAAYFQRSVAHLKTRPWYLKLVYRLIFAAY